jgi:hypothetical protein
MLLQHLHTQKHTSKQCLRVGMITHMRT